MIQNKKNSLLISLAFAPISTEIITAVFRYSHQYQIPLMLIASKNQIDHSGGYVNNWTTKKFMNFILRMRKLYPDAEVKICRDHCGPGFNGNLNILDVYKTIENDIKYGFDLIHIDFCHLPGTKNEKLEETKKAILYCLSLKPSILIEIGTDENTGKVHNISKLKEIENEIKFFKSFCNPLFYVVQTGSMVKEINQVGSFNKIFIKKIVQVLKNNNIELKEHNADYLSKNELAIRKKLVGAFNIAPQLGVIQTQTVLTRCLIYGIPIDNFLQEVYREGKWKKWVDKKTKPNIMLCSIVAGHYHFTSREYSILINELSKYENIEEIIIDSISKLIHHYTQ